VYNSNSSLTLLWHDNCKYEEGYQIQRRVDAGNWSNLSSLGENDTMCQDLTVDLENHDYDYLLYAFACGNESLQILKSADFDCGETFIDERDGQEYKTVQIGEQCWMAENLNIGTSSYYQTDNNIIEKICYDNDEEYCDVYGGLYQWDEMMQYTNREGTKGICPEGWHVPNYNEWKELEFYTGGVNIAGGKLKETGTEHWLLPNEGATNEYGFTGLGAGYNTYGGGGYLKEITEFWSSSESSVEIDRAISRSLFNKSTWFGTNEEPKYSYFSLRCILD
jgi:uncharacterized protein (TIGR02145 family)